MTVNIWLREPVLAGDVDVLYQGLCAPAPRDDGPLTAPGHSAVTVPARLQLQTSPPPASPAGPDLGGGEGAPAGQISSSDEHSPAHTDTAGPWSLLCEVPCLNPGVVTLAVGPALPEVPAHHQHPVHQLNHGVAGGLGQRPQFVVTPP